MRLVLLDGDQIVRAAIQYGLGKDRLSTGRIGGDHVVVHRQLANVIDGFEWCPSVPLPCSVVQSNKISVTPNNVWRQAEAAFREHIRESGPSRRCGELWKHWPRLQVFVWSVGFENGCQGRNL